MNKFAIMKYINCNLHLVKLNLCPSSPNVSFGIVPTGTDTSASLMCFVIHLLVSIQALPQSRLWYIMLFCKTSIENKCYPGFDRPI